MFYSAEEAERFLMTYFDPGHVDELVKALIPAIVLHPVADRRAAFGGTRLGGTPDVPVGFAWPRPPAPTDTEAIARRGNEEAARTMRKHMARGLPYAFIGQIDLSEAAATGPIASILPHEGRLLFFYDYAVGPWEPGSRVARVIWDKTAVSELASLDMPEDLAAASKEERAELETDADGSYQPGTSYFAPASERILRRVLRLPWVTTFEFDALPGEFRPDDAARDRLWDAYSVAVSACDDGPFAGEPWRRQQLLGSPSPEYGDPRYEAAIATELADERPSTLELDRIAREWLLLLQVDLSDWLQDKLAEGSVYFVIRRSDLAHRQFENVVAVHIQT